MSGLFWCVSLHCCCVGRLFSVSTSTSGSWGGNTVDVDNEIHFPPSVSQTTEWRSTFLLLMEWYVTCRRLGRSEINGILFLAPLGFFVFLRFRTAADHTLCFSCYAQH